MLACVSDPLASCRLQRVWQSFVHSGFAGSAVHGAFQARPCVSVGRGACIYIYIYISVCVCVWGSVGVWVVLGMCVCGGLGNACIKPVDGQLHISVGSLVISDISAYHESWLFTSFPGRRGDRVPFHLRGLQIDLRGSPSHL